jgi:hypothetical protein
VVSRSEFLGKSQHWLKSRLESSTDRSSKLLHLTCEFKMNFKLGKYLESIARHGLVLGGEDGHGGIGNQRFA